MARIVLASGSPRRKELLEQVGLSFTILPAKAQEVITRQQPCEVVMELSLQKAKEIADLQDGTEETWVIGADTLVAYGDKILGKPADEKSAYNTLQMLQSHTHQVYTGVTLIHITDGGQTVNTFYEKTDVEMYPISEQEIWDYISTKESMDKAGSYGIQGKGAAFIKGINGDYNNVVGLPVARLLQEMKGSKDYA